MSHFFSSTARIAIKWLGFEKSKLPVDYSKSLDNACAPGGAVEQKIGKIQQVNIKSRERTPIHQSHFNRAGKAGFISARIIGSRLNKTFHIYPDGKATSGVDDKK